MSVICDCGERVPNDEDIAQCSADNHRRALIRQAREALEATPLGQRDASFDAAMGELALLEQQAPPRPPDVNEVIDLIALLEVTASKVQSVTGVRPGVLLLDPDTSAQIRRVADAYPAVFGTSAPPPHARPSSIQPPSSTWIGRFSTGIDLYEVLA